MNDPSKEAPVLRARNIAKSYESGEGTIQVLEDLELNIYDEDYITIMGPSGVGKTTLLNILCLLDVPSEGEIYYDDRDVTGMRDGRRSEIRNRHFGFIYQFYHLIPELTALENVLLPGMIGSSTTRWFLGGDRRLRTERARHLLDRVGLSERESHTPSQLSGGERQRVAIARALLMQPTVLFCDEPTGNLDRETGAKIINLLENVRVDEQTALLIATHDRTLGDRGERKFEMQDGDLLSVSETSPGGEAKGESEPTR